MKTIFYIIFPFIFLTVLCGRPEVSETAEPTFEIIGVCALPGYSQDIDIKGDFAYVANDQGGLQIIDITSSENPRVVGEYESEKSIVGVAVRDTFAYLAVYHNQGGIRVINIAEPENPFFVGEDNWFYGYNVAAPQEDSSLIYAAGGYWFVVEDVSYPQYPTFVRRFSTPGNVRGIFVVDSLVFLACEQMGLHIFNLAKPDSEATIAWLDTPSNARNLFIKNNYAYIADGRAGLIIIDVSLPESPEIISTYDTPDYANDVYVEADRAYIADGDAGVIVLDISTPESPEEYGRIETVYANAVYVRNGLIYIADRDMGLVIAQEEQE